MDLWRMWLDLCTNPKHLIWLCPLILAADTVLCALIIRLVPCEAVSEAYSFLLTRL